MSKKPGKMQDFVILSERSKLESVVEIALAPDGRTLAAADRDHTIQLWETASGRVRCRFVGHQADVSGLTFSADGRRLFSASRDTTALAWDVTGLAVGAKGSATLTAPALEALWVDLASEDAG